MGSLRVAAVAVPFAVAVACAAPGAGAQPLYKYVDPDGKVVYTDKPPPSDARNVQPKRLNANVIETEDVPLAAQAASVKYPVTLYTFACGPVCQQAEALLNRRGVPYTTVDVSDPAGRQKLQALTGEANAPVLQVGEKMVAKGLSEPRWQALLDEAGYPKTPPLKRLPLGKGATPPPAPPPATTATGAVEAPKGGGYPNLN